jgi:pimeloyl-ACP methyl ester carboxylesterase
MNIRDFEARRRFIDTSAGRIASYEIGEGPTALFIHGYPLTAYHWRKQMSALCDIRRCVAVDLLGLGYTEPAEGVPITYTRQAEMIAEVVAELDLGPVDLVGNDSGGSISQVFAVEHPECIRTLTLTNCEVHDNNPPDALVPLVDAARAGALGDMLASILDNLEAGRAGFAAVFNDPVAALDEERAQYALGPIAASSERRRLASEYLTSLSAETTIRAAEALTEFESPILVVWGDADEYMPVKWAHWLEEHIPAVERKVVIEGGKLFFPEEKEGDQLNAELREFWLRHSAS